MTLTALTGDGALYNPSIFLDLTGDRGKVIELARSVQKRVGFFCPHCFAATGEYLAVRIRNSESRRIHFFHERSPENSDHRCANYKNMSERHLNAQAAIQQHYTTNFPTCTIKLEAILRSNPALAFSRPDVLILYPNGAQEVHEVQLSPITGERILERTAKLKTNGAGNVVWYLGEKAYCAETVNTCLSNAIAVYKIVFTDDDMPSWKPITAPIKQHPSKEILTSTCSYSSKTQSNVIPIASRSPQLVETSTLPKPKEIKNPYSDRQKYRHKTLGWEGYFVETPWGMEGITVLLFIPEQDRIASFPLRMLEIDTPMGWASVEVRA